MKSCTLALVPLIGLCLLRAQNVPTPVAKPQEPVPRSAQRNPFEAIPEPLQTRPSKLSGPTIKAIEFRGARPILQSALRAIIFTRVGDTYDVETLQRDSQALYSTKRFSHVVWEAEPSPTDAIIRFVLVERPLIQSIEYQGDNSVTIEEVLERFRQRKIDLRVDTLFDEGELPRGALVVQELVAEKGRQNFTVNPLVERIGPPSIAKITFKVTDADKQATQ